MMNAYPRHRPESIELQQAYDNVDEIIRDFKESLKSSSVEAASPEVKIPLDAVREPSLSSKKPSFFKRLFNDASFRGQIKDRAIDIGTGALISGAISTSVRLSVLGVATTAGASVIGAGLLASAASGAAIGYYRFEKERRKAEGPVMPRFSPESLRSMRNHMLKSTVFSLGGGAFGPLFAYFYGENVSAFVMDKGGWALNKVQDAASYGSASLAAGFKALRETVSPQMEAAGTWIESSVSTLKAEASSMAVAVSAFASEAKDQVVKNWDSAVAATQKILAEQKEQMSNLATRGKDAFFSAKSLLFAKLGLEEKPPVIKQTITANDAKASAQANMADNTAKSFTKIQDRLPSLATVPTRDEALSSITGKKSTIFQSDAVAPKMQGVEKPLQSTVTERVLPETRTTNETVVSQTTTPAAKVVEQDTPQVTKSIPTKTPPLVTPEAVPEKNIISETVPASTPRPSLSDRVGDILEGRKLSRSTRAVIEGAMGGGSQKQKDLAKLLFYGQGGLKRNQALAMELYRASAEQGNIQAKTDLAYFTYYGKGGISADTKEAIAEMRPLAKLNSHAKNLLNEWTGATERVTAPVKATVAGTKEHITAKTTKVAAQAKGLFGCTWKFNASGEPVSATGCNPQALKGLKDGDEAVIPFIRKMTP